MFGFQCLQVGRWGPPGLFLGHARTQRSALIAAEVAGGGNVRSRAAELAVQGDSVDAGLLRSFELNGRSVYEHDYGYPEHDHFYCVKCHQLLEFQSEALAHLRDEIARTHRFRVRSQRFIIVGVCHACSSRRNQRRRQDLV